METDSFVEVHWQVEPLIPGREIVVALMSEFDFDSFVDSDLGVLCYMRSENFDELALRDIEAESPEGFNWSFSWKEIPNQNWNAEWESKFEPVDVIGKLQIRAPFHTADSNFELDIIVAPKMAFGTGHHETTWLISKALIENPPLNLATLDMGCGTGVLAILSRMLGAGKTIAIDIDPWSVENTIENMELNHIEGIEVRLGGADAIGEEKFDLILANINRNILLQDMRAYTSAMLPGATIMFSGFFVSDREVMELEASKYGLHFVSADNKGDWAMLKFQMPK